MKLLTLGWELVPFYAGGLGIVCTELTKALSNCGIEITFVMPYGPPDLKPEYLKTLIIADNVPLVYENVRFERICSLLYPYITVEEYREIREKVIEQPRGSRQKLYGDDIIEEMHRFAARVAQIVNPDDFDIIHAHDWTTFPAGILLKKLYNKPLIVHVHITEFDKSGGTHADPYVYSIEQEGMLAADRVITVSELLKDLCVNKYFIPEEKITVVHNAPVPMEPTKHYSDLPLEKKEPIAMFAGRITLQKGPDYFVEAAKYVLEKRPDVTFIMAGYGNMLPQLINRATELGIIHKFIFTGYYNRREAERLFAMADVFVMPSVSEPFGLVAYEAQIKHTPVIVSKQSGVSEVLRHCLKVDFWDIKELANKILAVLEYEPLQEELAESGFKEATSTSWDEPAEKCIKIYNELLANQRGRN